MPYLHHITNYLKDKMKTRMLVTGSDGFIASHTIKALHDRGYDVIGIERHRGHIGVGELPVEYRPDAFYVGDIRDKSLVEKAVGMSDGVIHLAGILGTQETVQNPYPSVETNVIGSLNVLEAVKLHKVPMIQIAVGNHWMNNSYSITKTTAERFCLMYHKEHGVRVNVVRALNAFGEGQKWHPVRKMMPYFISQAIKNEPLQIYGDGTQKMDFVYVKDVANILVNTLFTAPYGSLYEAGTGHAPTVTWWATKIIEISGSSSKIEYLPMRPGEPEKSEVVAKSPYKYPYTKPIEALKKTIAWYKNVLNRE